MIPAPVELPRKRREAARGRRSRAASCGREMQPRETCWARSRPSPASVGISFRDRRAASSAGFGGNLQTAPRHTAGLLAHVNARAVPPSPQTHVAGAPWFTAARRSRRCKALAPMLLKCASPCTRTARTSPRPRACFHYARALPSRLWQHRCYFKYVAIQSNTVAYQYWLFCGFRIQCPSSGKSSSFDGTPCRCNAEKNSRLCVYGTR